MRYNAKTVCTLIVLTLLTHRLLRGVRRRITSRTNAISKHGERVLVLGATSGIGRSIARLYAKRGARVCVVGRREDKIREVVEECETDRSGGSGRGEKSVLGIRGDFGSVEDMIRVREEIQKEWGGVDTVVVAAGVSALQPLLAVAGLEAKGSTFTPAQAGQEGIQKAVDVGNAALRGNFIGPLVSAVTFIPLLSNTSKSPSILLISSLASVIPAPTRSIYASTKGASLLLYQSLAIEHPNIAFTHVLPSTVEGDFRASAVDNRAVRESNPNKTGLKKGVVARKCIEAVDRREKTVFLPWTMRLGHLLYWLWPEFVNWRARVKYNFKSG